MKIPLSWLKAYVPISLSPDELAHRLTMAGNEVGQISAIGEDWDRETILVGYVLKVENHPNADRLRLATVELSEWESITVVCGAPNVVAGQKIAFAKEGARLYNAHSNAMRELKATTIRGIKSSGMICSELELGMSDNHDGILVLNDEAPTGIPLAEYLGDFVLDIEVTPNRPDCLSILGIAHEVAALTGEHIIEPDLSYPEKGPPISDLVHIEIVNPDLCLRYTASLVINIQIGVSPQWMQEALIKAGQRPINNVVDITNYVMLEYGQPLHAFDYDKIDKKTIKIRAAKPEEKLITLDGELRTLNPPMLTIADASSVVGLAGIMGGANSEMTQSTTSVILESACFDPVNTRRTRS